MLALHAINHCMSLGGAAAEVVKASVLLVEIGPDPVRVPPQAPMKIGRIQVETI